MKPAKKRTCSEGHDSCPQVAGVEWYIDAGKRDGGESTLELDVTFGFLKVLGTLVAESTRAESSLAMLGMESPVLAFSRF